MSFSSLETADFLQAFPEELNFHQKMEERARALHAEPRLGQWDVEASVALFKSIRGFTNETDLNVLLHLLSRTLTADALCDAISRTLSGEDAIAQKAVKFFGESVVRQFVNNLGSSKHNAHALTFLVVGELTHTRFHLRALTKSVITDAWWLGAQESHVGSDAADAKRISIPIFNLTFCCVPDGDQQLQWIHSVSPLHDRTKPSRADFAHSAGEELKFEAEVEAEAANDLTEDLMPVSAECCC